MIRELIDSGIVIESLDSTTREEALDEMLRCAVEAGEIKPTQRAPLRKALIAREESGSTGIGNGFAVPHVKTKHRSEPLLIVGRSAAGIPFQAVDGRDVHTVFLLLGTEEAPEDHLQMLRWISTLARNADFRRFVQSAASEAEIRDLLHEMHGS